MITAAGGPIRATGERDSSWPVALIATGDARRRSSRARGPGPSRPGRAALVPRDGKDGREDVAAAPCLRRIRIEAHGSPGAALQRGSERAEHGVPAILDVLQFGGRHGRARPFGEERLPSRAADRDVAPSDGLRAATDEHAQASIHPRALTREALPLVLDDGEAGALVEAKEQDLERVGIDLPDGGTAGSGPPSGTEGLEGVVTEQGAREGLEPRIARRAVRRGVEASEHARNFIVAAAPALPQPEEGRIDADGRASARHAPGDPVQHLAMARQGARLFAKLQGKARAFEADDAGAIPVLPGEVDAKEPHGSGTAMLPASTVTAEPPTRTRVTLPSWSWSSTRSRPGRPSPSPCSAVKSASVPLGWSSPASNSQMPMAECTEPVTMSSGMPKCGAKKRQWVAEPRSTVSRDTTQTPRTPAWAATSPSALRLGRKARRTSSPATGTRRSWSGVVTA